ncbi:ferredoxin [Saccharopolyspora shandongensis]|uniref:ferredoxin n=1 Tax=Saccharopolyspora shandongensis TaxID=418495 RepID=UPI0033CE84D6
MNWSIEVDTDTCIGSALCVGIAPEHFELVEGFSRPRRPEVDPAEEVTDAAESCPVEAITVRDAGTGEVLAPER